MSAQFIPGKFSSSPVSPQNHVLPQILGLNQLHHLTGAVFGIIGLKQQCRILTDLRKTGRVRSDDRNSRCKCLNDRDSKSFIIGGMNKGKCTAVQCDQFLFRYVVAHYHPILQLILFNRLYNQRRIGIGLPYQSQLIL